MRQEDFCQLDTHSPSAGELRARTLKIFALETEANNCTVHFCDESRLVLLFVNLVMDGHYLFSEGLVVLKKHHLREVTDGHVRVLGNASGGRLIFARDEAQQSRFAGSVLTYEGDALLSVDEERNVVQHRPGRELHTYMINR